MLITCDSGADITVVPEECVDIDQFTGGTCEVDSFNKVRSTGKLCNIVVSIAGRSFYRKAVTQPGKDSDQMDAKFAMEEEQTCYLPAEMKNGILTSVLMVSEGTLIPTQADTSVTSTEPEIQRNEIETESKTDEGDEQRERDELVLVKADESLVVAEEEGERVEGSTEGEGEQGVTIEGITQEVPTTKLTQATQSDPSLSTARSLADKNTEGYHYSNGILFRTRLDPFGKAREQICLPQPYRLKCLKLAHNHFGHQGRNKKVELIRPFFYWPTIILDCLNHIKQCEVCQKMDKAKPKPCKIQEREIVSIPAERVAIDLVGPFPAAVGGFRFLLISIDLAMRWPEAIPLRTVTAKVIIVTSQTSLVGVDSPRP